MKKGILLFLFLWQLSIFAQIDSSIIFSEVMFYPSETNGEFIELYNSSPDSSINLTKFQIIYSTSAADTIIEFDSEIGAVLPPKSYAIIFENDYDFTNGLYLDLVPNTALMLQIDNGKFGSSGMANTSDRTINLLNEVGDTIDTYTYSANNSAGISDEKIDAESRDSEDNWGNSIVQHGTPGFRNSISPRDYDLEISDLVYFPEVIFAEDEIEFSFQIKNKGKKEASNYEIKLFVDLNHDASAQSEEIVLFQNDLVIPTGDSLNFSGLKVITKSGSFNVFGEVIFAEDENRDNDSISTTILIRPKPNEYEDIVINEIMFKPNNDEPEWVELFNRSKLPINLKDWRFADRTSKPKIIDSLYFIGANEFLILTEDETITDYYEINSSIIVLNLPSLNNIGDELKLIDSLGQIIDSVNYYSQWGSGDGYSLERIDVDQEGNDSTNWNSSNSKQFATPGKINSITPKNNDLAITDFIMTNEYGVMGETFNVKINILNIGLNSVNTFSLLLFHDVNLNGLTEEEELTDNILGSLLNSGDSTMFEYDLIDFTEGENRYIAKIILDNDDNIENNIASISFVGVKINEVRYDLIINEIMHSPNSPEPEWIEVFNRSSKTINMMNYHIADLVDTNRVVTDEIILNPNQYFVFADDSSFIEMNPDIKNYLITSLPNLNNAGDKIVLLDSLYRVIDSLQYSSTWGGTSGKSLERREAQHLSVDSTNWGTANLLTGGTPGKINSLSQKNYDIELLEIYFNPEIPKYGEDIRISVKAKNVGKKNAEFRLTLSEDIFLDSTKILEKETSEIIFVQSADSVIYQFNYIITDIISERKFLVGSANFDDQDTINNFQQKSIAPSFENNSVIINEIMYSPINGEAEWIELYNSTNYSIDLKYFTISDIYTTPKTIFISDSSKTIEPNGFLIIAKDSLLLDYHKVIPAPIIVRQFANLNNDIDGIVIKDRFGVVIDSMEYKSNWGGGDGYSIERKLSNRPSVDSLNWGASTDIELSTPGRKNSITPFEHDLMIAKICTFPNPPILNDEITLEITINNIGLIEAENYSIQISYEVNGENSTLAEIIGESLFAGDSLILKTSDSIYLYDSVLVKAELIYNFDENHNNNYYEIVIYPGAKRDAIIINEFMANPNNYGAEWIELLNNSNRSFDISTWFISDLFPTPKAKQLSETPIIIEEDEYLVITNDTSKYSKISNEEVIEVKFGTLGNIEDGILLYDFNMSVVDSLKYDKDWEIKKGRSLERLSKNIETSDYSNWLLSLSVSGSSPGISNSILETEPAIENSIIINEIMYDPNLDNSEFVELYNSSEAPIDIGGWQLIDGSDNYYEISSMFLIIEPDHYFLFASDSSILNNYGELLNSLNIKILETGSFSFSNVGESLVIIDHWGNMIDSVCYNPKWHNKNIVTTKNKTLERISPLLSGNESSNWSTSVSKYGATPGSLNSIFTENKNIETGLTFEPNPFSPDEDGFEDFSIINYSLPFITAQIRIKIFDDKGRLVRTLVNNEASSSEGAIVFDGLNDSGNPLRIGMYIVFLEAVDTKSGESIAFKDVIVVARKL